MADGEQSKSTARGEEQPRRGPFDRFAETTSNFVSSSPFFALCLVSVATWLGGLVFDAGDRFVNAAVGVMAALTLLLVAVLKNAELRAERAIQLKLDAIAKALLEDREEDHPARGPLGDAIGLDDEI
jgi:low affinity Fe/Cu permease